MLFLFVGASLGTLLSPAHHRIDKALKPCTSAAYLAKFKLFVALPLLYCPMSHVCSMLSFLELLAQNGSMADNLSSYVAAISHFFELYDIPSLHLSHRKFLPLIKSASINVHYALLKATFTIPTQLLPFSSL